MALEEGQAKTDSNASLKFAIAMALLRSKLRQKPPPPPPPTDHPSSSSTSESDAQKWKRKAKERKQELLRLKEDLKQAEDYSQCDLFPQSASCKCYFFDNLGECPSLFSNGSDWRFNDVLRRRFLRQVRLSERRKRRRENLAQRQFISDCNSEDEIEQLRASVDFLVELCDSISHDKVATNFANWSHQAGDFILVALKNVLLKGKNVELLEGIVSSLIVRLVKKMCSTLQGDELHHFDADAQFYVQHLIRKLGSESNVGQRVILSVSQRISILAESLLFMDPFDDSFPSLHDCMYMMAVRRMVDINSTSKEGIRTVGKQEWALRALHGSSNWVCGKTSGPVFITPEAKP